MSFPRYEVYKESGVEWLGEVPEHWDVEPLKHHAKVFPSNVDKKSYEGQAQIHLCNYTDVYYNEEIVGGMKFMIATATEEQIEKFTLQAGDTIFTKDSEAAEDIAIAAYVPKDLPGVICGYHLSMVRPSATMNGGFIKRFFDSCSAKAYFEVSANGLTRVGLSQYATDNIPAPVPPLAEQAQIAHFLDRETARIDALIAEQERLIELLKEKRQAVISHAVTKGLDPTAPMKDSGVEWLGEVPKHWEIRRLKHISPRISGRLVFKPAQYFSDEGIPFLMGNNITEFGIRWEGCKLIPEETNAQFVHYALKERDVITVRVGDPGVTCVVPPEAEGLNCGSLMIIRRSSSFNSFWLAHVMNSPLIHLQIDKVQYGAAQEQINITDAVNFLTPVPPLEEQKTIVTFLRNKISQFNALISEAETVIQLLKERRSALISAAVTGKIDVRDWNAPTATLKAAHD